MIISADGVTSTAMLRELLPNSFGPLDLGVTEAIMGGSAQATTDTGTTEADTGTWKARTLAAAAAADSYAPYSKAKAAVVLRDRHGCFFIGKYLENAAFNPSISPMAAALSLQRLAGCFPKDIVEAVLAETGTPISHARSSKAVLAAVSSVPLKTVRLSPVVANTLDI